MPPSKSKYRRTSKTVVRGEIEKTGMADHIWKEKGNNLPLWDEVKIIDWEEHWRIRRINEWAHMWPVELTKYRDEYDNQ